MRLTGGSSSLGRYCSSNDEPRREKNGPRANSSDRPDAGNSTERAEASGGTVTSRTDPPTRGGVSDPSELLTCSSSSFCRYDKELKTGDTRGCCGKNRPFWPPTRLFTRVDVVPTG